MNKILQIENTLKVICDCWDESEKTLQLTIEDQFPGKGEVFITEYFHGLFKKSLDDASKEKRIENAFIQDLKVASPYSYEWLNTSRRIANGLIAEVTLHSPTTETKTGGDLGLVISRPQLSLQNTYSPDTELFVAKDYRWGLLTQAKLRNERAKWGEFTDTQKEKLPNHLNYLALLLYRYKDQNRRSFEKFKWQLCAGIPFSIIEEWLKTDTMPNLIDSYQILNKLGTGEIGTDDEHIIKDVICPLENQTLIIHIHWPNGDPPMSRVRVHTKHEMMAKPLYQ